MLVQALVFAIAISIAGFVDLWFGANPLAASLGLFTLLTYLFVYTPLKQRSPHSTTIGSIPGAMPPLIGFAAASGTLTWEAWVLFAILFLWQFPHFYAIAWMYREDYARAGIRMLPVVEPDGKSTARRILLYSIALIPISLMPKFFAMAGNVYLYWCAGTGPGVPLLRPAHPRGSHAAAGAACVAGIGGLSAGVVQPDVVRPSRNEAVGCFRVAVRPGGVYTA